MLVSRKVKSKVGRAYYNLGSSASYSPRSTTTWGLLQPGVYYNPGSATTGVYYNPWLEFGITSPVTMNPKIFDHTVIAFTPSSLTFDLGLLPLWAFGVSRQLYSAVLNSNHWL